MDCVPSLGYSENTLPRSWHSRSSFPACPAAAPQPAPHNVVPLAQAVALAGRQPLPLLPQSQAGVCEAECNNAIDHGYSTGVPMGPPLAPSPMEVVYFSPTPTSIGAPMVSPAITTITYGCVQQKTTPILTTSTSNTYEEQQPTFFSPMIETTPAYHLPPPQELSYMQNYSVQQPQQMQLQQKPSASLYQEAGYGVNASSSRPMCQQPCCMPSSPYSPPAPQYQLQPQQEQPYFQGRCSPGHEAVLQTACAGCSYAAPVLVGAAYSQASPQLQPCVSCIPQQQQFQQLQPVQACQPVSGVAEACCCGVGSPSAQLICTQPQQPVLLQQSFSMPMQHSQQQQPLQRSLSDGSAVSTVYTFGACEEGSSPALLAASRSGSSSQGGAAGYNSPLSSSEGPVMARGSSSPLEQCLQEGPCSIGEQVQPTDDVLAPEQPMLMQDAIEIEEKAVTKAPAPRRRPAPVTHIVGIGGLLCLPPKKTKSTTAGTVQWYAGFRSPLGKEGRAELIKRMRVVHRNVSNSIPFVQI